MTTIENAQLPVYFDPPLVDPSPHGLYAATSWTEETGPTRWLAEGIQIRPTGNYGGADAFGVWLADWCSPPGSDEGDLKTGSRPEIGDPFLPITVWAYDECDLTAASRTEVRVRAAQILQLEEQTTVEREFAARLLADIAAEGIAVPAMGELSDAVGYLEGELAKTNTVGQIHASAALASAGGPLLFMPSPPQFKTMLGHRMVFGGGYVEGLGPTLVATSAVFGWRDAVQVRETLDAQRDTFAAIAERSVVVGVEKAVAAVTVAEDSA
ncbi:MAG: hypothetical protein QG597_4597 [Actinomycetota bacterium]|nr:hypothetical protein [Actinomycetota bacterium]